MSLTNPLELAPLASTYQRKTLTIQWDTYTLFFLLLIPRSINLIKTSAAATERALETIH